MRWFAVRLSCALVCLVAAPRTMAYAQAADAAPEEAAPEDAAPEEAAPEGEAEEGAADEALPEVTPVAEPAPVARERDRDDACGDDPDCYDGSADDDAFEEEPARPSEFALILATGGQLEAGLTPGILSAGPSALIGLRIGPEWSVQLLGAFDHSLIHDAIATGDQLAARVFTLGPEGCYHFAPGLMCVGLSLGAFMGRRLNEGLDPEAQTYFFTSSDVRGGFEITVESFFIRILAEARIAWTSIRLNMQGEDVWTIPPVAGALRVFIGGRIDL